MNITRLSTRQSDFDARLTKLLAFEETADEKLEATVAAILADVKKRGDAAVLEYTRKFDRLPLADAIAMELPRDRTESRLARDFRPTRRTRWNRQRSASPTITRSRCSFPGTTWMTTAPCWGSKSRRWIASASMCRAARRPIRLPC